MIMSKLEYTEKLEARIDELENTITAILMVLSNSQQKACTGILAITGQSVLGCEQQADE